MFSKLCENYSKKSFTCLAQNCLRKFKHELMLEHITLYIQYFAWGCTRYLLAWCILVACLQWSRINEFVLGLKSVEELCHSPPMGIGHYSTAQGGFCMDNPNLQPVRNNPAWQKYRYYTSIPIEPSYWYRKYLDDMRFWQVFGKNI